MVSGKLLMELEDTKEEGANHLWQVFFALLSDSFRVKGLPREIVVGTVRVLILGIQWNLGADLLGSIQ